MERKFFVLVPVYKTEKFIDACIQSVLDQTYGNFRLILVDDGTPDRAGEICDVYARKDPRITVIHKENGGQISARNAAVERMLSEADGESFAVFLDSDDTLKPQTLQTLNDAILEHPCDMVIYGIDRVFQGKVLYGSDHRQDARGVVESKRELYRIVFSSSEYNPICRKAIREGLLRKMMATDFTPYHHIRLGEDLLQSITLYEHCEKAVFISQNLYNYTDNPNSVSNNRARYRDFVDSTVRRLVLEFLERQPEWTQADMEDYLRYCRKRLATTLLRIGKMQGTRQEKIALLAQIEKDGYYRRILATATKRDTLLCLLTARRFHTLLLLLKLCNLAVWGKRTARKLLAR